MERTPTHWSQRILDELNEPDKWIIFNDEVVVIADKYPKAEFHYLVLPRENIPSIHYLTKGHLKLMEQMYTIALDVIKLSGREPHEFKIGYHAEPSMQQLHLHVISTDFNSPTLKTERHWNSFHTKLFVSHHEVMLRIRVHGKIERMDMGEVQKLRRLPMKCDRCATIAPHIRALKIHLMMHVDRN